MSCFCFKSVPSAFEKLVHEVFFMNEIIFSVHHWESCFRTDVNSTRIIIAKERVLKKGKPGYHFYKDVGFYGAILLVIVFFFFFIISGVGSMIFFLKVKLMPTVTFSTRLFCKVSRFWIRVRRVRRLTHT